MPPPNPNKNNISKYVKNAAQSAPNPATTYLIHVFSFKNTNLDCVILSCMSIPIAADIPIANEFNINANILLVDLNDGNIPGH